MIYYISIFLTESSFSLSPNIPYGWFQKNETINLEPLSEVNL